MAAASGDVIKPLFATLAKAGYTACTHPRPTPEGRCRDCGAVKGEGGSMTYAREPWLVP